MNNGLEIPSYLFAFVILLTVGAVFVSHAERAEPLALEERMKLQSELALALSEGRKDEAIDLYRRLNRVDRERSRTAVERQLARRAPA